MSFMKINDIELYYEIHGQGEPLLFIHGLGSSSQGWQYQYDYFAQYFQVILVDVRGHGQTSKTSNQYSIELFASDISELMKKLNFNQYHLVGLSMGGAISFQLSLDTPEAIKSMTIVNSWPDFTLKNWKQKIEMAMVYSIVSLFGLKAIADKVAESLYPNNRNPELYKELIKHFCENDKSSFLNSRLALTRWSVMNKLSQITCPTFILAADNDYTSVAFKEKYSKMIKGAKLTIVEDSYHALPVEKPHEFNPVLLDFLQRQS